MMIFAKKSIKLVACQLCTQCRLRSHFVVLWFVTILLIACSSQIAVGQYPSLIGADGDSIDLAVPSSGFVPLIFHHTATDGASFSVDLSTFLSGDDQPASVNVSMSRDDELTKPVHLIFTENQHRAVLQLHARDLVPGVKYVGTMTASSPQGLQSWKVTLHRPNPRAELVTDLDRVELDVKIYSPIRFFFGLLGVAEESPGFLLTLREKSRNVQVDGITIRRAGDSEAKAVIDLDKHIQFALNGVVTPNLTSWPVTDAVQKSLRSIPPGEQRSLRVSVANLPCGEHKLWILLDALNVKPGTAPKIELIVRVRHSIVWAIGLLFLAISISFFFTKFVINWRQRLNLHKRTRALHREWLQELRELAPVVWLKATRKQAEMVLEKFSLLPAPEELAERLDTAARLLDLLRRYRDLRNHLKIRSFPYILNWRMEDEIDKIVHRIEPVLLDEVNKASFATELDAFDQALADPVSMYKPLVMEARRKVKNLVSWHALEASLDKINASDEDKKKLRALLDKYVDSVPDQNPVLDKLLVIDRVCASFRILWKYRDEDKQDTLEKLLALIAQDDTKQIQMDRVFELDNGVIWKQIELAVEKKEVYVMPSKQKPKAIPVEALYPTRFELVLKNDELNDSFMVKTRMIADWSITLTPDPPPSRWWRLKPAPEPQKPTDWYTRTTGKTLVQFAPEAGKLDIVVNLRYDNQETKPIEAVLDIQSSRRNSARRFFVIEEFVLITVSFAIALTSGLVLYYVPKPIFGSLQDYVALFTWGVGVDQGKNFVKTFQNLRRQSSVDDTVS